MKNQFIETPANKKSISKRKSVFGVGTNDVDYQTSITVDGKAIKCPYYQRWVSMLQRCYSYKFQAKTPSYKGCEVVDEWLTLSKFKDWMAKQDWEGKQLDKDILFTGNKIYSPETCIFVTTQINSLINDQAKIRGRFAKGVTFNKPMGKFQASCNVRGKQKHLGCFKLESLAGDAYRKFKQQVIISAAENQIEPLRSALIRISNEV